MFKKVQCFANFQDLTLSFTTKELLRRCFEKAKVIRYTAFFESAEQLLFGTISHGCFSVYLSHNFTKVRQLPSKQLHVGGQQYKNYTSCEMCIKFTIKTTERGQLMSFWCLYW